MCVLCNIKMQHQLKYQEIITSSGSSSDLYIVFPYSCPYWRTFPFLIIAHLADLSSDVPSCFSNRPRDYSQNRSMSFLPPECNVDGSSYMKELFQASHLSAQSTQSNELEML